MSDAGEARRRSLAARAWRFRCGVEREAEVRFARLAGWLEAQGAAGRLVALARRSSSDEARHALRCADLARAFGAGVDDLPPPEPALLAPPDLPARTRMLYEAVAACCVTETGSVGVLATLLGEVKGGSLRRTLRELARDEVRHAQLGWAVLAAEGERSQASLLSPWVPAMLAGSIDAGLFGAAAPGDDDDGLLELGLLPQRLRREVFVRTTLDVVLPGLEAGGIDPGPARHWLAQRTDPGQRLSS
ncbi:MAG: ferritin-like domain-containing protein [Anaeromyxobacter sp.]